MQNRKLVWFISSLCIIFLGIFILQKNGIFRGNGKASDHTNVNNLSTKTVASNQWYSSLYKTFPSQSLFAFPLAYQVTRDGLGMSYPTVTKTPETIYGSYVEDLHVGIGKPLQKPTIQKLGNWSISLLMHDDLGSTLGFTLAQGVPSTMFHTNAASLVLTLQDDATVYNNGKDVITKTATTDAIRISVHDHNYIVVFPKSLVTVSGNRVTLKTQQAFVGLLDTPDHFALFKQHAKTDITDTVVTWSVTHSTLETTYSVQAGTTSPLIALFPHQADTVKGHQQVVGSYDTIRGKMQLVNTATFTTSVPLITPDVAFVPLQEDHSDFTAALSDDTQKLLQDNEPDDGDYNLGTWYGKAANVLLLLDAAGMDTQKKQLLSYLEPKLLRSLNYLRYQSNKQSVIADKPEFGNENLNDHHFHYGYYIRAAAVISRLDPSYTPSVKNYVNLLVKDLASTDRTAAQFPFLRNFSVYEGHSYADGFAVFGDGNDQESSSEAINAWYGIYLWSQVIHDTDLANTALYLYNTEIIGTKYYWFGKNGVYTAPYSHVVGTIIWGGKVDFATWFSDKTNMKYGIQLLPITPGSFGYLGTLGDFSPYENDYLTNGGSISDDWGDLFVMWESFYNPDKALSMKDQVTNFEANDPKSLFLYTLYHNQETR